MNAYKCIWMNINEGECRQIQRKVEECRKMQINSYEYRWMQMNRKRWNIQGFAGKRKCWIVYYTLNSILLPLSDNDIWQHDQFVSTLSVANSCAVQTESQTQPWYQCWHNPNISNQIHVCDCINHWLSENQYMAVVVLHLLCLNMFESYLRSLNRIIIDF